MAERDQVRSFLAGHDAGYSRYSQNVAFFVTAVYDQLERGRLHFNIAFGDGCTLSDRLFADVNHVSFAGLIKVG